MNPWIAILTLMFWWWENQHFGWNVRPGSDAELIADGIVFVLFALAIVAGRHTSA